MLTQLLARITSAYYVGVRERDFLPDALVFIDRASDELVRPDESQRLIRAFAAGELPDPDGSGRKAGSDHVNRLTALAAAYDMYQAELRRRNAVDYGAMVARLVELWRADAAAPARLPGARTG
jgi:superfamily I DNA/RNA helicase